MKKYTVIGYQTRRMEITIEASSPEEATGKAEFIDECASDLWQEDYEWYGFEIVDVLEMMEE